MKSKEIAVYTTVVTILLLIVVFILIPLIWPEKAMFIPFKEITGILITINVMVWIPLIIDYLTE